MQGCSEPPHRSDPKPMLLRSIFALCLWGLVGASAILAQEPATPDSTAADSVRVTQLPELNVTVTRAPEPLSRVPMAVAVLDQEDLRRGQLTAGLDEALNNVPGVYVANRYNFSVDQRISIRGFGSRATFGARGIKVLLDGVPQTLPDGQSQLTNVDFGALSRVEILRGSSSSLYGNASGGVLDLRSEPAGPGPFSQRVRFEYGEYGTDKWQSITTARRQAFSGVLSVSRFTTTGFRQNSAADIRQLNASLEYLPTASTSLTLRVAAADNPLSQNPGALTLTEYTSNRDSAAANNLRRGADKDVQQQQLSLQLRHFDDAGNEYSAVVFGQLRDLENPIAAPPPGPFVPTAGTYIRIDRGVAGVRLSGTRRLGPAGTSPRLTAGVDLQRLGDDRQEFRSESGQPIDSVLVDQQETVTEIGPFAQVQWTPTERVLLIAGGRYDRVTFDAEDRHFTDGADNSGSRTLDALSASLGGSYVVTPAFIPYANIGTSFETPTTNELGNRPDGQGGFNDDLGPQRALSLELGARGDVLTWASYSVAAFTNRVTDAIVQFAAVDAAAYFTNAGRIDSKGVELGLSVRPIPRLSLFGSYTFADYTFDEYLTPQGAEVSGNRVPGVPRHFTRIGLRSEPVEGFALDVDHTLSSSLPADDVSQLFIDNWGAGVTNLRVSWSGDVGVASLAPFIGINNVWERDYISSVTINGVGGRVLEPAPGRVVYVGAEIGYRANP